jgi:hypothetical protein
MAHGQMAVLGLDPQGEGPRDSQHVGKGVQARPRPYGDPPVRHTENDQQEQTL